MTDINAVSTAALSQYSDLIALINKNIEILPTEFKNQYESWKSISTPIINIATSSLALSISCDIINDNKQSIIDKKYDKNEKNFTSLLIKERLKPHELQKLKNQNIIQYETSAIKGIEALLIGKLTDPSFTLPLPPVTIATPFITSTDSTMTDMTPSTTNTTTSMINPTTFPTFIHSNQFDWKYSGVKKSKNLKNFLVITMAGFLRIASEYLRQNPLYIPNESISTTEMNDNVSISNLNIDQKQIKNVDKNTIQQQLYSSQDLAHFWVESLVPIMNTEILTLASTSSSTSSAQSSPLHLSSTTSHSSISPNQWEFITIQQPTIDGRKGNLDFLFDIKNFVSARENKDEKNKKSDKNVQNVQNAQNDEGSIKDTTPNGQKRKTAPLSSSPTLSPSTRKQKINDISEENGQNGESSGNNGNDNDDDDGEDDKNFTQIQNLNIKDSTPPLIDQTQVYNEIAGLFDFAPTTGESRHCIDSTTTDLQQFQFTAMGYINSCYRAKFSTPRQGNAAPSSHASLTLHNDVRFHSVLGLEQYSHVWLLFVFHSNAQGAYRPKITPPRLGERVGCLATRSPHRWNDIGLSLVKLDQIEYPENFLHLPQNHPKRQFYVHSPGINSKAKSLPGCARLILSNVDLIDGTPIIDVKPFNPGDMIPDPKSLRLPTWLATAPMYTLNITFHKQALMDVFLIFKKYYKLEAEDLLEKSKKFQEKITENDKNEENQNGDVNNGNNVSGNGMDKNTFQIYSNLYKKERIAKIIAYLDEFYTFIPSIEGVVIDTNDNIATNNNGSSSSSSNSSSSGDNTRRDEIQEYLSHELGSPLQFYPTITSIRQAIIDTLRNDPRPIWTKFENRNHAIFGFLYDNLNIVYQMNGNTNATVCFLQHRQEYNDICMQIKHEQKQQEKERKQQQNGMDNNGSVSTITTTSADTTMGIMPSVVDPIKLAQKRGWLDLIKAKITQTTIDPTDSWAKQIHSEYKEQKKETEQK